MGALPLDPIRGPKVGQWIPPIVRPRVVRSVSQALSSVPPPPSGAITV